jgi:hypothetical protein
MTMKTTIISSGAMPPAPPGAADCAQASGIKAFMHSPWSEVLRPARGPGEAKGRHYATAPAAACREEKYPRAQAVNRPTEIADRMDRIRSR